MGWNLRSKIFDSEETSTSIGFEHKMEMEKFSPTHGVNLYIKYLDNTIDDERLYAEFLPFGKIISVKVMMDRGRSKGFGFVCFESAADADRAVREMHGRVVGSKPLYVALAQCKKDRQMFLKSLKLKKRLMRSERGYVPNQAFYSSVHGDTLSSTTTESMVSEDVVASTGLRSQTLTMNEEINLFRDITQQQPSFMQENLLSEAAAVSTEDFTVNPLYTSGFELFPPDFRLEGRHTSTQQERRPFTSNIVPALSTLEEKRILGQMLFPRVRNICETLARQIIDILLELDNETLFYMLEHNDCLEEQIQDTLAALQDMRANETTHRIDEN